MNDSDHRPEHAGSPFREPVESTGQSRKTEPPFLMDMYASSGFEQSCALHAKLLLNGRARIREYLDSSLFSDPAFDIVLDLYATEEEGSKATSGCVAKAARVPPTTGLRYVAALEKKGFVERWPDPFDKRRVFLKLSKTAKSGMSRYLKDSLSILLNR